MIAFNNIMVSLKDVIETDFAPDNVLSFDCNGHGKPKSLVWLKETGGWFEYRKIKGNWIRGRKVLP